ncbi:het-c2 protein [Coprinopsis cinerea AmutBmut pab1-1]|nr:het-c2 protein [Coprinopsis cinerea AmutBmut pab1-1]
MKPYFESVKSFADVTITENGVDTVTFLEASDGLVELFGLFGSAIFEFLQSDLRTQIKGIRARYEARMDHSGTLEALVQCDYREESEGKPILCVILLLRGLHFVCQALQRAQSDKSTELRICFKRAYDEVLRQYHPFFIREIAALAIRAVPRRNDFYAKIAQGAPMEKLNGELDKWLVGLDHIVQHMGGFLSQGGYGTI